MILPTVKVQDGASYRIINESDFDEKTMKLFVEPKAPAAKAPESKTSEPKTPESKTSEAKVEEK